jgi:hypothetical protein
MGANVGAAGRGGHRRRLARVNEAHAFCGREDWRALIREVILPWALGHTDLGDDVLEVGPG